MKASVMRALVSAGATSQMLIAAAEAEEHEENERVAAKREKDRIRKRVEREIKKSNENNNRVQTVQRTECDNVDIADAPSPDKSSPTPPENYPSPSSPPSPPKGGSSPISEEPDEVTLAVAAYNAAAAETGWPKVQKLTDARRAALRRRLIECGGIDGWRGAMARARGSPFLTGETGGDWRADFDFFLKASKFTKLMEGAYDRSSRPAAGQREADREPTRSERSRAAMAEVLAGRDDSRLSPAPPRPPSPVGPAAGGGIGDVLPFGEPPSARFGR